MIDYDRLSSSIRWLSLVLIIWGNVVLLTAWMAPVIPTSLHIYFRVFLTLFLGWGITLWLLNEWSRAHWATGLFFCPLMIGVAWWFPGTLYSGGKDVLGLILSMSLGTAVAWLFHKPGYIVGVLFLGAMVDFLSVVAPSGVTKNVAEDAPHLLRLFAQEFPLLGTDRWVAILGFADWLFLTVVLILARRYRLPVKKMVVGIMCGLLAALAGTLLSGAEPALPALPFLALGLLWPIRDRLDPSWEGYHESLGLSLVGLIIVYFIFLGRFIY